MGAHSEASSTVLEEASDVESDGVQRAFKLLGHLQRENKQLAENFDNLAAAHSQLQTRHDALKQERVDIERQYQQLCESWRQELEQKQREFDAALARAAPPLDVDLMRAQLLDEVEAPHRDKCERLAKEAEAAQEAFVRLRREHESLQNAHKALEQRRASELQLVRLETDAAEAALGKRLAGHAQLQERAASLEQQLRAARRQGEEAAAELRRAREEAAEMRAAKEAAVVEREQGLARGGRAVKQLQAEAADLRALSEGLARKARHLQGELDESTRAQEATHGQLLALQAAAAASDAQLADARAAAARERQLAAGRAAAAEQQWRDKVGALLQE
ncbi:hypothetical protein MNEG_13492 [Monoraphidium neglectum]|uniref:Uncharacterized protein n=1 Tax=Monoraphidium neglectum TaxID=145388 RepID=A0A0D2LYE1_9CHLO|nr:hypothetical protein MNEG_13492 [Monoraphidium neglectum]KIY94471.1 hypothetical protein MNEG_13492 [Monoraphidium neglectum]|eukprot:XP_013893491.1 hypothetical protein MNEG_13492 [Monoraphidium neglectum]